MHIKELSIAEFDTFAQNFPISSYYQSSNYALFMAELGYDYELIGFVDELGIIKAASLILIKKIGLSSKYGYSPKGFLVDYFDLDLLKKFTEAIRDYYSKKLAFIKINPEIAIGEIDIRTKLTNYNQNIIIRDYLKELGYLKLKDNKYFESLFPRFNGILNLREYSFSSLEKNTKNKIRKAIKKGLVFEKADRNSLDILFQFIKKKKDIDPFYYKNYFNVFARIGAADLFLIKIDYQQYLVNSKRLYDQEFERNQEISHKLIQHSSDIYIKEKMNSDKILLTYKNDIEIATKGLRENRNDYIAGAFVIRYLNRIHIAISGYDKAFKHFDPNYFLHYNILEFYKDQFKFVDLNGMTGDFTISNPYKGLNQFKLGFKPHIYEFIGEFDLILNERVYRTLIKKGLLAKEFNKKTKEI
ncbi:tRNA-dependent lipid II--L-alanine ligase [Mycoplasma sp. CAG:776]|nr:tRNA-dependent lipid II--L-alanine ligase [Mycoplasma sp. CAG:776]